jgi:outer membrane protein OmpA-like peptidoglycan-associated protein
MGVPGKRARTDELHVQRKPRSEGQTREAAASGTAGPAERLPFLDVIQRSFGAHDLSGARAHTDAAATSAWGTLGAKAFATGNQVAFAGSPDLHTAAHEAAHIVQQSGGVSLKGGIGEEGDVYERHADEVADAVVQGRSAESMLNRFASTEERGLQNSPTATQFKGLLGESIEDAKEQFDDAQGVPERGFDASGAVEKVAPGHYRVWGFPVDSAEPPAVSDAVLDELVHLYAADPKSRLTIEGHTSTSGSEKHNEGLATLRANRLLAMLIYRGLPPTRVNVVSVGEKQPLAIEGRNALLMARNRRVEIRYQGEFPSPVHVATTSDKKPPPGKPEDDRPGIGCRDLRSQANMLRVELDAWVMYSGSRGGSSIRGNRDPGLDADRIAPDRMQIVLAARDHGYHQTSEWDHFVANTYLYAGANLDAHMRELRRSIDEYERMAAQPGKACDPNMALVVKPFDPNPKPPDPLNPEPNSTAPGGQRY